MSVARYITPEGARRLRDELDQLWRVKRPRATQAVAEAAAMGDRSENAEYIYGKKLLREIDGRIRFLRKTMDCLRVVDRIPHDTDRIYFGAWVRLRDEEENVHTYHIVGPDESDAQKGFISVNSPMAKALLKKSERDEIIVRKPGGEALFTVIGISYEAFDS
jgi:transcription elongation factor GreB